LPLRLPRRQCAVVHAVGCRESDHRRRGLLHTVSHSQMPARRGSGPQRLPAHRATPFWLLLILSCAKRSYTVFGDCGSPLTPAAISRCTPSISCSSFHRCASRYCSCGWAQKPIFVCWCALPTPPAYAKHLGLASSSSHFVLRLGYSSLCAALLKRRCSLCGKTQNGCMSYVCGLRPKPPSHIHIRAAYKWYEHCALVLSSSSSF